ANASVGDSTANAGANGAKVGVRGGANGAGANIASVSTASAKASTNGDTGVSTSSTASVGDSTSTTHSAVLATADSGATTTTDSTDTLVDSATPSTFTIEGSPGTTTVNNNTLIINSGSTAYIKAGENTLYPSLSFQADSTTNTLSISTTTNKNNIIEFSNQATIPILSIANKVTLNGGISIDNTDITEGIYIQGSIMGDLTLTNSTIKVFDGSTASGGSDSNFLNGLTIDSSTFSGDFKTPMSIKNSITINNSTFQNTFAQLKSSTITGITIDNSNFIEQFILPGDATLGTISLKNSTLNKGGTIDAAKMIYLENIYFKGSTTIDGARKHAREPEITTGNNNIIIAANRNFTFKDHTIDQDSSVFIVGAFNKTSFKNIHAKGATLTTSKDPFSAVDGFYFENSTIGEWMSGGGRETLSRSPNLVIKNSTIDVSPSIVLISTLVSIEDSSFNIQTLKDPYIYNTITQTYKGVDNGGDIFATLVSKTLNIGQIGVASKDVTIKNSTIANIAIGNRYVGNTLNSGGQTVKNTFYSTIPNALIENSSLTGYVQFNDSTIDNLTLKNSTIAGVNSINANMKFFGTIDKLWFEDSTLSKGELYVETLKGAASLKNLTIGKEGIVAFDNLQDTATINLDSVSLQGGMIFAKTPSLVNGFTSLINSFTQGTIGVGSYT
ncbi:MAG: hypothetical protein K2I63_01015, partial [Helicobacter sp.]|nr:hypothetical protein [Helicobacter sp.]